MLAARDSFTLWSTREDEKGCYTMVGVRRRWWPGLLLLGAAAGSAAGVAASPGSGPANAVARLKKLQCDMVASKLGRNGEASSLLAVRQIWGCDLDGPVTRDGRSLAWLAANEGDKKTLAALND